MSKAIPFTQIHHDMLLSCQETLQGHTLTLGGHSAKLDEHTVKLDEHTVKLDEHTVKLDEHTVILAFHTQQHTEHRHKLLRLEVLSEQLNSKIDTILEILTDGGRRNRQQDAMALTLDDHENRLDALEDYAHKNT